MARVSGSIRNVTINGVTYDVLADANFSETGSRFENEGIATSGETIRKMTRRVPQVESVIVKAAGADKERLKGIADGIDDVSMSYETAAGDVYRATGFIEFENRETEENRATLTMIPRQDWRAFLA